MIRWGKGVCVRVCMCVYVGKVSGGGFYFRNIVFENKVSLIIKCDGILV